MRFLTLKARIVLSIILILILILGLSLGLWLHARQEREERTQAYLSWARALIDPLGDKLNAHEPLTRGDLQFLKSAIEGRDERKSVAAIGIAVSVRHYWPAGHKVRRELANWARTVRVPERFREAWREKTQ